MILYINVIITEHRNQGFRYDRYGLPWYNRYDIFKYSLASLGALNKHWSRVVMYCQLDHPYTRMWDDLEGYVHAVFNTTKVKIYRHRNILQKEWQRAYERDIQPVNDSLIWYHGNDDHVFIDYNLDMIDCILEKMYADPDPFISCMYSHWPEYIRYSADNRPGNNGCCATFESFNHDAIHIVSKKLFKHWFYGYRWGPLNRTDHIKFFIRLGTKCYVPYRELVRHFDGYSHSIYLPHACPPLHIPPGFFKHKMRILYCSKQRRPGWLTLNPLMPPKTIHPQGADYCYTLDDMPMFWRDRIIEIETEKTYPKRLLYEARNREKLCVLDPNLLHAGKKLPVLPLDWMAHWLFLHPERPTLL